MKNLKKVLALVMAFAMAFTMFAGAVNFDDVKAGDDYSAAISMLSDLEVVSGNGKGGYEPAKAVTRAEMCVLIANMMNGGKADTARFAGGSNFSDVAKSFWGESAIAYCVQNGITAGVGGGKFAPSREITDKEAVAMLTRAMGYDTAANPLSFPYGNYTAAVNNGLVDNVPYVADSVCTKGEAAQMIYDCLFADYARLTANLNVIHGADDHGTATLIKDVFGLDRAANGSEQKDGSLKCTQHYWVILGNDTTKADTIVAAQVDDKDQKIGAMESFDCAIDVSALVGYKVVLWGETKHAGNDKTWDVEEVLAIEVVDDQAVYGNDVDTDEIEIGEVATFAVDYKTAYTNVHMDEDLYKIYKDVDGEDWLDEDNTSATFKFIDWNNDGECEFVVWDIKAYAQVEYIDDEEIDLITADDVDATLDLDADDYVVVADGVEEDDIVEITVDRAYDKGEKGEVLTITLETVEAEVAKYTKRASNNKYYFDGEEVTFAENEAWVAVCGNLVAGKAADKTEYELYKDVNGNIVFMKEVTSDMDGYFMVLDTEDGEPKRTTNAQSRKVPSTLEVMMPDGTIESFDVDYDLDFAKYDKTDYTWDEYQVVGYVFEYSAEDGVITDLKSAIEEKVDFEYDGTGKNERILLSSNDRTYVSNTLKGDDFLFVVTEDYITNDSTESKGIKVDTDEVIAVTDLEQLPDEINAEADTKPEELWSSNTKSAMVEGDYATTNAHTSKRVVNGAVLCVDTLLHMQNNVKVGLVTFATEYENDDDEMVYDITVAMNNEIKEYTTVEISADLFATKDAENDKAEFEAAVDDWDANDDDSDVGLYCELYFNADGEITMIDPMEPGQDDGLVGEKYLVDRLIVDTYNEDEAYMTFLYAQMAESDWVDKDNHAKGTKVTKVFPVYDANDYALEQDVLEDVSFFTIKQGIKPATEIGAYLLTTDGFFADLYDDVAVADGQKVSKIVNNNTKDRIYIADVIFERSDWDVVATYTFEDYVKEQAVHQYADITVEVNDTVVTANSEGVYDLGYVAAYGASAELKIEVLEGTTKLVEKTVTVSTDGEFAVAYEQDCVEDDFTDTFEVVFDAKIGLDDVYGVKAFTNIKDFVGVELYKGVFDLNDGKYVYTEIPQADLEEIDDADFTVTATREVDDNSVVGTGKKDEDVTLTFNADKVVLVTGDAAHGYMALIPAAGVDADMDVTVSVVKYGTVTIEVGAMNGTEYVAKSADAIQ